MVDSFFLGAAFGALMVVFASVLVEVIRSIRMKREDGDSNG